MSASGQGRAEVCLCANGGTWATQSSHCIMRGDVYLWLCHVVKPMLNGSRSPSIKLIIINSDNKVMSDLRRTNLEKCFFLLLWVRMQGCKDLRIRRTNRCNSTNTIRLLIVHLYTTLGLGSPTRQCLRENEQHSRGSPYPAPLWKVRSDFATDCLCFLKLNGGSSPNGWRSIVRKLLSLTSWLATDDCQTLKLAIQHARCSNTHTNIALTSGSRQQWRLVDTKQRV